MGILYLEHKKVKGMMKIKAIIKTMRPAQWLKNTFVFAPLFFSGNLLDGVKELLGITCFLMFCSASSAMYFLNDILDRDRDRVHPRKKNRPIASGELSIREASLIMIFLAIISFVLAGMLSGQVAFILLIYVIMNTAYSFFLKHIVIADVFCIATGFVLRVIAGAMAIDVKPSPWIVMATFLLALFLALAKRRQETVRLINDSTQHRPVLEEYSSRLLDELISVVTPVVLITYLMYTLDHDTQARFHSEHLYITGVPVVFGIFRYLYLIHRKVEDGDPTQLVLRDKVLLLSVIGWVLIFGLIVYLR